MKKLPQEIELVILKHLTEQEDFHLRDYAFVNWRWFLECSKYWYTTIDKIAPIAVRYDQFRWQQQSNYNELIEQRFKKYYVRYLKNFTLNTQTLVHSDIEEVMAILDVVMDSCSVVQLNTVCIDMYLHPIVLFKLSDLVTNDTKFELTMDPNYIYTEGLYKEWGKMFKNLPIEKIHLSIDCKPENQHRKQLILDEIPAARLVLTDS